MIAMPPWTALSEHRHASLLVVIGLMLVMLLGHLTAGEDRMREISVRCNPDQSTNGSLTLSTWTLVDDPSAYRPEDIVLTQDHLDRMRLCWATSDDGHTPKGDGIQPVIPTRTLRMISIG